MQQMFSRDVLIWLFPAFLTIGAVLIGLAAAVGLLLIISPRGYRSVSDRVNRWYPSENVSARLNPTVQWSRYFYRHHVFFGSILAAGAGYALLQWGMNYNRHAYLRLLDPKIVANQLDWIVASAEAIFVLLNILALLFSIVVVARPSALKDLEAWSDSWIEGRLSEQLDKRVDLSESWIESHPRLAGGIILLVCLYITTAVAVPARVLHDMILR